MNLKQKLVVAATATAIVAPAALVLGRKISQRIAARNANTDATVETN
jgi:hypothetical protein